MRLGLGTVEWTQYEGDPHWYKGLKPQIHLLSLFVFVYK